MSGPDSVFVEAPARLHFGVLDLAGRLGRHFGGLGAAIPCPSLLLEASPSLELTASGPDSSRALDFARMFLSSHGLPERGRLIIHRSIPSHAGLGSGTQLGLAVARALAELNGITANTLELAAAVARGKRSAIGTWAFALGGFIVEGGRRVGSTDIAPLLARYEVPAAWRCVVAVPQGPRGLSGEAEIAAFDRLSPPSDRDVERVSHLVLMQLLPALVEADLPSFGDALSEVQRITGAWFAGQQGGIFAPGPTQQLVTDMAEGGAVGVGQSSWGPAAYGLVPGDDAASALAQRLRKRLAGLGVVFEGGFASEGARVWEVQA
jgi:beta-ribofuranosylaminobenzene 5'-phosphate synthase